MKRVAIVGCGCSGLAAIKCCLDDGIEPVCFEREDDLGGLWNYSESAKLGKGSVYKNCVINTSKEMMAFSDFPPPADFPMFMPHTYVLKYFKLYAQNFGLLKHVNFSTSVLRVVPSDKYECTGSWNVTYQKQGHGVRTEEFDGVLVCTGHHTFPYQPDFSGLSRFRGTTMHSHGYRDNVQFTGKKVLVVGIGNSAVDIAVDISHVASQVYVSTRKGAWVISRMGFWGLPADAMANNRFLFSLPSNVLEWAVEKMANFRFDHETYGLKPSHGALQAHPTINDELPYRIMTGGIKVKPNVYSFSETAAHFDDGSIEDIDAIVFATGYEYKINIIDESVTSVKGNRTRLYKYMFPPHLSHPSLAVVGLVQPIGAVMPISEMQCRWFTRVLKGEASLPSQETMQSDIDKKAEEMARTYVTSQRHTLQCFWVDYMDEIAREVGVRPDFFRLFMEDPVLAMRCYFGPCVPSQYRLMGPGKWNGARRAIENTMSNCLAPLKTRITPENFSKKKTVDNAAVFSLSVPKFLKSYLFFALMLFVFFCMCLV